MNQELMLKAITFAVDKHNNSKDPYRKGTKILYVVHPIGVMNLLLKEQFENPSITEEVIVAGILHDTVEDTDATLDEIEHNFGSRVRDLVFQESELEELKNDPDKKKTWRPRKEHTIDHLKVADKGAKLATCADKLDNLRCMVEDYMFIGEDLWKKFNAPKLDIEWYYRSVLKSLSEGESIEDSKLYRLFEKEVKEFFGN
jgi:(p)ppGpp synthase/HD superfamily hydrolase